MWLLLQDKTKSFRYHQFLLFVIFLVGLTMRYKWLSEPTGLDSFSYANSIEIIETQGKIWWFYHILSLFGQYPYAEPSGWLVFCTTLKLLSNTEIETLIFLNSILMYTLLFLSTLCLSRKLFRSNLLVNTVVIGIMMNPIIIWETMDTVSLRLGVLYFFISYLTVFYMNSKITDLRYFMLIILMLFISLTVHKISLLFFLFFVLLSITSRVMKSKEISKYQGRIIFTLPILFSLVALLLPEISFGFVVPKSGDFYSYSIFDRLSNLILHYGSLTLPFVIPPVIALGLIFNYRKIASHKITFVPFLISASIFIPTMTSFTYGTYFAILILTLGGAMALNYISILSSEVKSNYIAYTSIVLTLLVSLFATATHTSYDEDSTISNDYTVSISQGGFYLDHINASTTYGDSSGSNRKMTIYNSDTLIFRVSPEYNLLLPLVEDIFIYNSYLIEFEFGNLFVKPDELFKYDGEIFSMRYVYDYIPEHDLEENQRWINLFGFEYYINYFKTESQTMSSDLQNKRYSIYDNGQFQIFRL